MQLRVSAASDALRPQQVDDFLVWYDGLHGRAKDRIRSLARDYGPNTVKVFGRLDIDSRRVLRTDGGEVTDDIVRAADDIDDVDAFVDDVLGVADATAKRRAIDLIDETGNSGIRLLDELDGPVRRSLLDSDAIETDELVEATRKYGDLDSAKRSQFRELLADDDLRDSWVRVSGSAEIDIPDVERSLSRVDDFQADNHEVLEFHRTKELNEQAIENGYKPPHEENSIAIDADMSGKKTLYRLEQEGDELGGMWLVEKNVLEDATTKRELIDKMALLPDEWGVKYDTVVKLDTSEVEVTAKLRVSTAGEMRSADGITREGGATQYQRIIQSDANSINNGWSVDGRLTKYVKVEE